MFKVTRRDNIFSSQRLRFSLVPALMCVWMCHVSAAGFVDPLLPNARGQLPFPSTGTFAASQQFSTIRRRLEAARTIKVARSQICLHGANMQSDDILNPKYELLPGGLVPARVMDEWMIDVWEGREGHCAGDEEEAMVAQVSGEHAGVYGEITPDGFRDVAKWMCLHGDDVFMDMGSGVGRTVMQAWLEFGVQSSIGVELAPSRHARATRALGDIAQRHESLILPEGDFGGSLAGIGGAESVYVDSAGRQRVQLIRGDLLQQDVTQVTAIWLSSLCFGREFLAELGAKLALEAPLLRCVASMARFEGGLEGFAEEAAEPVQMSWTREGAPGTLVYLYAAR